MHNQQLNEPSIRNGIPRPTLEITTPAVCNPGVTVELEAKVNGGRREEIKNATSP